MSVEAQNADQTISTSPDSRPQVHVRWLGDASVHCHPTSQTPLPGQPPMGLVAFDVRCADGSSKILSAQVAHVVTGYKLRTPKNKGDTIAMHELDKVAMTISHPSQSPASVEHLKDQQLRRPLSAGSVIYPKDITPLLAWRRNEQISIVYSNSRMYAKTVGTSVNDGALNERSQAKVGNKMVVGTVRKDPSGGFFLETD